MTEDPMLEFLEDLKKGRPEQTALLEAVAEGYRLLEAQKELDRHYLGYPPGHFYSPVPSKAEFQDVAPRVYGNKQPAGGIDLREREQFKLYARLAKWHADIPFPEDFTEGFRYYFRNNFFTHADAFWLYAMLREFRPRKVIEVGSGFSSALMLDTNEQFLDGEVEFTFIEPHPERLWKLLEPKERAACSIRYEIVQNVPLEIFSQLKAGDFLFIDSSHVAKIGSDVLHLLGRVLPALEPGVFIHFHDIFYPFEYPRHWLEGGTAWNECYFLSAFLQYNDAFAIRLFGNYLGQEHEEMLRKNTPICLKNIGASLWMEKLR